MPQSKTDLAERLALDALLRAGQVYLVLLTADPTEGAATAEPPTGDGYARMPVHFSAAATNTGTTTSVNDGTNAGGGAGNGSSVIFGPVVGTNWTLWGVGVAQSGVRGTDDLLYKEPLAGQPITAGVGSTVTAQPGDIVVEEQ